MLRLKRYDMAVKGGFAYVQPETGMRFNGDQVWKSQIRQIRAHRVGNHLPRQSLEEVADDLEAYTCNRLPNFCKDRSKTDTSPKSVAALRQRRVGGCSACGGRKR